jgi:hypothetical protein
MYPSTRHKAARSAPGAVRGVIGAAAPNREAPPPPAAAAAAPPPPPAEPRAPLPTSALVAIFALATLAGVAVGRAWPGAPFATAAPPARADINAPPPTCAPCAPPLPTATCAPLPPPPSPCATPPAPLALAPPAPSFFELGTRFRTDKVAGHAYYVAYESILAPWRVAPAGRFLEIGLGCGMYTGADEVAREGHSLALWLSYFPPAWNVTTLEFNGACLDAFRAANPFGWAADAWGRVRLIAGSQAVPADLMRAHDSGGPFDVVVDDGGHSYDMQITAFRTLFPLLAPGGMYVVEDLGPNGLAGRATRQFNDARTTFVAYLNFVLHKVIGVDGEVLGATGPFPGSEASVLPAAGAAAAAEDLYPGAAAIAETVESVRCWRELCAIFKCRGGGASCGRTATT